MLERGRITEELGHANQQVAVERVQLLGICAEPSRILGQIAEAQGPHAPVRAPSQRGDLVFCKVHVVRVTQERNDQLQPLTFLRPLA